MISPDSDAGPLVPDESGLAIAEVSRVLGVPMPTLRSWELRYSIPEMPRGSGKHRRYYYDQLHALRLMRDEIARGQRAGDAARAVKAELDSSGPARAFVDRFLAASLEADRSAQLAALDEAKSQLGLLRCFDDVVLPAMRQVGVWWQTGRCEVTDEHVATALVRSWIASVNATAPPADSRAPLLLACGPGDLHTIGLEALDAVLRSRARSTRYLGPQVQIAPLLAEVASVRPPAVVLVSHLATGRRRCVEAMQALHDRSVPVFYAGNAFVSRRARSGVPGVYLGGTLTTAITGLDEAGN
ncbi:MAG: regulatory protein MerR [Pseudonocardiales bacterium]|nr:regulatory protein MerR [Pseudonocardiales bacterium]